MLKILLITFIPVSGCVTSYVRDTDYVFPQAYVDGEYRVIGWKEKFYVKPGPIVWHNPRGD